MIEVSQLTKTFGSTTVLDMVDFRVESGEIFGIVGPSGSGKSTLARCLNLLTEPTSGDVIVNGDNLTHLDAEGLRAARRRIGTVFQRSSLLSRRTAAQNVALPLQFYNATKRATDERVRELLARIGLSDKADLYPHQLSGGQRQRVGIARALALNPSVLLSDEATSGLDPRATDAYLNLIADLRDELDIAVVLITHEMDTIVKVADRVGHLEDGRIVEQGDLVDVVLNPDSPLGSALRSPSAAQGAPAGHVRLVVTYSSRNVPADWIFRIGNELAAVPSVLGAVIQTVHGVSTGEVTVSVESHRVAEFRSAAARYGLASRIVGDLAAAVSVEVPA